MNKPITALLFSLFIGFSGSTYSADSKPLSPQKFCAFQANTQLRIAEARSSMSPATLAEAMWNMFDEKKISATQLATALTWIIEIYSSPMSPQDIHDTVYKECMATIGKDEI